MDNRFYDVAVIGAGPAGLTSALYCRRAEKTVVVFEKDVVGGQVTHSPKIENYPGMAQMRGLDFAERLTEQVKSQGAEIIEAEVAGLLREIDGSWKIILPGGEFYHSSTVIIAAGVHHRTLGLEGEEELEGSGVSYCAVCDGAFYRGLTVAVIGGGNSALQEAVMLSELCRHVYVIQNLDYFTGEQSLVSILRNASNVELITGTIADRLIEEDGELRAVHLAPNGEKSMLDSVTGIDTDTYNLPLDGVFVAIGLKPENEIFSDVAPLDKYGYIEAGEDCSLGNGLFVAGDCRTKSVRQIATAISDGAAAAVSACRYIMSRG